MNWFYKLLSYCLPGLVSDDIKFNKELEDTILILGVFRGFVYITVLVVIFSFTGWFLARGVLWSLGCFAVGILGGFLFGVPRVIQNADPLSQGNYQQKVNTNLEEISDWLTKIIVGLGLYQLSEIPSHIGKIAALFAASIQIDPAEKGYCAAIIIFFTVVGFLMGYLITRVYLQIALGRADRAVAPPDIPSIPRAQQLAPVDISTVAPAVEESQQERS